MNINELKNLKELHDAYNNHSSKNKMCSCGLIYEPINLNDFKRFKEEYNIQCDDEELGLYMAQSSKVPIPNLLTNLYKGNPEIKKYVIANSSALDTTRILAYEKKLIPISTVIGKSHSQYPTLMQKIIALNRWDDFLYFIKNRTISFNIADLMALSNIPNEVMEKIVEDSKYEDLYISTDPIELSEEMESKINWDIIRRLLGLNKESASRLWVSNNFWQDRIIKNWDIILGLNSYPKIFMKEAIINGLILMEWREEKDRYSNRFVCLKTNFRDSIKNFNCYGMEEEALMMLSKYKIYKNPEGDFFYKGCIIKIEQTEWR